MLCGERALCCWVEGGRERKPGPPRGASLGLTLWEGDGRTGTLAAASTDSGAGQAEGKGWGQRRQRRVRGGGDSWRGEERKEGTGAEKGTEGRTRELGRPQWLGTPSPGFCPEHSERCAHRLCPPAGLGFPVCEITWSKAPVRSELRWGRGGRGSPSPRNLLSSPPVSRKAGRGGARAAKAGGPPRPPGRRGPQPGGS